MNSLTKLYKRIKSDTPRYFRKLIVLGGTLTATGGAIELGGDKMPEKVQNLGSYLIVAGATIAAVSKTATTDTNLSDSSNKGTGENI